MQGRVWILGLLLLAFACGDKKTPAAPPAAGTKKTEQQAKKADADDEQKKAVAARKAREEKKAALKKEKAALQKTISELKAELREMDKKHAEEKKALADPRKLRPYVMRLIQDSNSESGRLASMERQYEELKKKVAGTKVSGELKTLQDKMKEVEGRYWKAHSGWMTSREEAKFGPTTESPTKRDLELLRGIRTEWLRATPQVRRGAVPGGQKKIINNGFRAWIDENPERARVAAAIVNKEPASYDFTSLKFYIKLSIHELKLEKLNIVEDKKELDQNRVKLDAIEAELDTLREQVAEKMAQGGGDLERYQDLSSRMQGQREKAADLKRMVEEYQIVFAEIERVNTRQLETEEKAANDLDKTEKDLRRVNAELREVR